MGIVLTFLADEVSIYTGGKKEPIPPFPHHKDFVYRVNRFFG